MKTMILTVLLAVMLITIFLSFTGLHGRYRDMIAGNLHDDCIMCSVYRFMHANDPVFAIREAKRNN
jgi:hypothetical protein